MGFREVIEDMKEKYFHFYSLEKYIQRSSSSLHVDITCSKKSIDPNKTIDFWFQFNSPITVSQYSKADRRKDDLKLFYSLTKRQEIDKWCFDIKDIFGLTRSKAMLDNYSDLDDFAVNGTHDLINDISITQLSNILKHSGIRAINKDQITDGFYCCLWDGRIFLDNSDGSHHFAAAYYIAKRINEPVPLFGNLAIDFINTGNLNKLLSEYNLFLVKIDNKEWQKELEPRLVKAGIVYYYCDYEPVKGSRALIFVNEDGQSAKICELLKNNNIVNLNEFLEEKLSMQFENIKKMELEKYVYS